MYSPNRAAAAYGQVAVESSVMGASPHQLILLLYDAAEQSLRMAIRHMQEGDFLRKAEAISRATSLIHDGLRAGLDPSRGGALVGQLEALYDYMTQRILAAHSTNDPAPLIEVLGLLTELHDAWKQVGEACRPASLAHTLAA